MPIPTAAEFSVAARVAAHTALRDLIDAGASAGYIAVRGTALQLLATVPLSDPCGTVSGTTGQLTLSVAGPDAAADLTGAIAYAEVCDSAGTVHLALPAEAGTSPVVGKFVVNSLSVVAGTEVSVLSAVIG